MEILARHQYECTMALDKTEYKKLLMDLTRLDDHQAQQVQARLTLRQQAKGVTTPKEHHLERDYLLQSIEETMRAKGYGRPSDKRLQKELAFYRSVRKEVLAPLAEITGPLSAQHQLLFGRLCARALVKYLTSQRGEISYRIVLLGVEQLRDALDAAFPGYIDAGLLSLVITGF